MQHESYSNSSASIVHMIDMSNIQSDYRSRRTYTHRTYMYISNLKSKNVIHNYLLECLQVCLKSE
jgi:hypothetical protein